MTSNQKPTPKMTDFLFGEFEKQSKKAWKQKIQSDLKGEDYNDALIWKSLDDISVKPFYHQDDKTPNLNPNTNASKWSICEEIHVTNDIIANKSTKEALKKGADCIKFIIPNKNIKIETLIATIDTTGIVFYFELQFLSPTYVNYIYSVFKNQPKATLYINTDIIGNLAKTGNWFTNFDNDHVDFKNIVQQNNHFCINLDLYENAGASIVQQLAYGLSHANEYLNYFNTLKYDLNQKKINITFNVTIGSNYFFEIAKLRALRILWKSLSHEYKLNVAIKIFAKPTKRNKTIYDYNTNMLRTVTECMSAIIGGADSICNIPYNSVYQDTETFGARIARNQLLILKHESYFNKVNNPADGAYYIEALTHDIAKKALLLFKNIELGGGFLKQLKEGTIQRKIKESAAKAQNLFNTNKDILIGTNTYIDPTEKMKSNIHKHPFVTIKSRKTLIEPVIEKRLAEMVEQERLKNE